jgi:hypothetical protein
MEHEEVQSQQPDSLPSQDQQQGSGSSGSDFVASEGPTPTGVRRLRPRPPKLYRIGEVVEYSGVSRQTIHNYTTMGLLVETRWTDGGHRLYDESVFERLDQIVELKRQRMSLEFIREHFARLEGRQSPGDV